ncbi:Hsp33 family molecular chaperone HslO [Geothermobacter hydrogeniphilus]|uniref:33 kDa chaperonin n=1 Tax=Geothermobacter hydrogeniphilus TaxID=1969733 RepID=A0A1X0YAR3_9BACT|nr:Hsp33 family molecular chaperone HslO [Geothermobacter hydrogeniphilus]ORJ62207.1 Hsp33 family molecular chaperone [Geothermobacter hydrogeniphilus]
MPEKNQLIRILSDDGTLRGMAAETTGIIEEIRGLQQTDPVATIALGRLATGTALMGALLKDRERLALMMEGNGPLRKLHAETDADGSLRASIANPLSGPPPEDGSSAVARAIGKAGFLHVIKDLGLKEPYRSMVQLQTSEVGEDIAYYLTSSEQIPSAVAVGVLLDAEGRVEAAGGFLIQALPGCPDATLEKLEQTLNALPPITTLLQSGRTPEQVLGQAMRDIPYHTLGRCELRFRCNCSLPRVTAMLRGLPEEDRRELAARDEPTVITCEYCRKTYSFSPEELAGLGD